MRIMFEDLNEYAQKRLLAEAGIKSPEERNWDIEPIAIVDIEEDDDDDMENDSMDNVVDYGHDEP
ncbi:MAG TPA: hypothetical protein VMY06_09870 [Sedimentisphaerales bacterium]|nr:hypothetical protein [Sedimentisphaerales bacterium]